MEPKKRVPDETRRKLALMGALTSYRVSAKIGKMFGWAVDKMTIWKSVQQIGANMDFAFFESLKGKVTILIQRCLWHIPYQAQYVLWKDAVKRKSEEWLHVVAELMEICAIRPLVDCPDTIQAMIASKPDAIGKDHSALPGKRIYAYGIVS